MEVISSTSDIGKPERFKACRIVCGRKLLLSFVEIRQARGGRCCGIRSFVAGSTATEVLKKKYRPESSSRPSCEPQKFHLANILENGIHEIQIAECKISVLKDLCRIFMGHMEM